MPTSPPTTGRTPSSSSASRSVDVGELVDGLRSGDRATLGRAITLVESSRADHREVAQQLLAEVLPETGGAIRVGITGVPGVGKSTFLDALGTMLLARGSRLAVLAVDPSSAVSGGSILGDKTRMANLASHERSFVRPSPSGGSLGGVARKTRESMLLCEAAGFDTVLVETVGVGQSETVVAEMVDSVLLLLLPGGGDELQGIKRGILELIDVVAVNKADGEAVRAAQEARIEYESGLRLIRPSDSGWTPPVLTCSAKTGDGLDAVWQAIQRHRLYLEEGGLEAKRQAQQLRWMWSQVEELLLASFRDKPKVASVLAEVEESVRRGRKPAIQAAQELLKHFSS
ncbi:MAG: methylmalonyl Co-A mutase-associated GTPase MeaB [Thermoanaerobaculia bacterium]|nr:methylmalonyl Co-A mutase-associated GTPase MeaB [Thermoanaerobaculia bacterium]